MIDAYFRFRSDGVSMEICIIVGSRMLMLMCEIMCLCNLRNVVNGANESDNRQEFTWCMALSIVTMDDGHWHTIDSIPIIGMYNMDLLKYTLD